MPYTLWSRGRMLGESDLGFVQISGNHRMGWFHPSPEGKGLMSILTGTGPALKAVGKLMRHPVRGVSPHAPGNRKWPRDLRTTTEYADLVSSVDELEAMDLQLRDPNGVIIEVEHVGVDDTEFKKTFLSKRDRRRLARLEKQEPWEPPSEPFPRYQIQVFFSGSGAMNPDDQKTNR